MGKLSNKQILKLVEMIISHSSFEEVLIGQGENVSKSELAELINKIYMIIHGHSERCPHIDWQEEAVAQYKKLIK